MSFFNTTRTYVDVLIDTLPEIDQNIARSFRDAFANHGIEVFSAKVLDNGFVRLTWRYAGNELPLHFGDSHDAISDSLVNETVAIICRKWGVQ